MKKNSDLLRALIEIQDGLDILDPDDEEALLGVLKSTTERVQKTIETLSTSLQALATKLPDEQGKVFQQAALACSQITGDPDWKKAEDLILLVRAALGGVKDQMDNLE